MQATYAIFPTVRDGFKLVADAADLLHMSRPALWKAIQRGQIQTERVGPVHVIHLDEIERFRRERPKAGWPKGKPRKTEPPTPPAPAPGGGG